MTDNLIIKTNRVPRALLNWGELTPKEQAEFDWLYTEDAQWEATFVRYRKWVYSLDQFTRIGTLSGLDGWDGYHGDSYFSGVLIKLDPEGKAIMATYFS